jgi:sulfonate transport system permease protein
MLMSVPFDNPAPPIRRFAASRRTAAVVRPGMAPALLPWIVPAMLLLGWYAGTRQGWIPPQVLPSPAQVWATGRDALDSGLLWSSAWISLARVAGGFVAALLVGVPLGAAMGFSPVLRDYLYPVFKIVAYVPLLAWIPLMVMILGIGEGLKVVLIAKAALVPLTINTCQGIRSVPAQYIELAAVHRFTRWQLIRNVIFPAAFPQAWAGVRYGVAVAWLTMVAAEYLAASEGLGYLMASGQQLSQLDLVIVAAIAVAVLGLAIDRLLAWAELGLSRWRRAA